MKGFTEDELQGWVMEGSTYGVSEDEFSDSDNDDDEEDE